MNESAGINSMDSRYVIVISVSQVKCSHELCRKIQVRGLDFFEVCETAFQTVPPNIHKYFRADRIIIPSSH